jgi:hypothetical protein
VASATEGLFPTCNVFYRRAAYLAAGGFDPGAARRWRFKPGGRSALGGFGEDTLLAWRVARQGAVAHAPRAVVHHAVFEPDRGDNLARAAQAGAFAWLVREVPELRSEPIMTGRWQLGDRSRLPVYGMVAALTVRSRGAAGACFAWWIAARLRELRRYRVPWSTRLKALPDEMCIDVVTAAALATGSLRARRLVL